MKKKILLLTTFIFALVAVLYGIDAKEVKADDTTCETYTNYYLFLDIEDKNSLLSEFESKNVDTLNRFTTSSVHEFNLPEGTRETLDSGEVNFYDLGGGIDNMSYADFLDYWNKTNDGGKYVEGNVSYIRGSGWTENGTAFNPGSVSIYNDDFEERIPEGYGNPSIKAVESDDSIQFDIKRTWGKEEIESMTLVTLYGPAAYWIQYEVCPVDDTEYKVTAHYVDKTTDKELTNDIIQQGLKDGDSYDAYTCPNQLTDYEGYTLDKTEAYQHKAGTIENKDVDLYCYYDKKATLTINYGTNNDCSEGTDIRNSETNEYIVGSDVKYTIPSISGYAFSNVGSVSPTFSPSLSSNRLTFDMPAKNTSICLVFIKNPQTGTSWIYLAWIIGIMALAYSGWYFVKYYRNQNNSF